MPHGSSEPRCPCPAETLLPRPRRACPLSTGQAGLGALGMDLVVDAVELLLDLLEEEDDVGEGPLLLLGS